MDNKCEHSKIESECELCKYAKSFKAYRDMKKFKHQLTYYNMKGEKI